MIAMPHTRLQLSNTPSLQCATIDQLVDGNKNSVF